MKPSYTDGIVGPENSVMSHNTLTMLGTGNAIVTRCYNTCFVLSTETSRCLVDAGGGNGVLSQLEKAGIDLSSLHDMFVTHAHTDHILGAVWVVRMIINRMKSGRYEGAFTVYGHDKVLTVLDWICRMTLSAKDRAYLGNGVLFHEVKDKERFEVGDMQFRCFDILSTKEKQFGFQVALPGGQRLVCLGDEPYNEANRSYVEGADWMLCEAFCLYRDRDIFKPYEKHHSTALEAGSLAEQLRVKNLLLYHTEDRNLATRKELYRAEALQHFTGRVFVPDDLETVELS